MKVIDRWQFKVVTHYDNRPIEVEYFTANSKEEIDEKYHEYLKNKGSHERVSEPYPIS